MVLAHVIYDANADTPTLRLSGALVTAALGDVEAQFKSVPSRDGALTVDISGLSQLDTSGASMIVLLERRLQLEGNHFEIVGGTPEQHELIRTVATAMPVREETDAPDKTVIDHVAALGMATVDLGKQFVSLSNFVGLVLHRLGRAFVKPSRLRITALFSHMQDVGWNAVPIVGLMGFLIGVVLAFQGAVQLRQFGAEVFVVDLIAVSVLRELGILLTAIIVAGRSGSAFTASIGSMKIREEIDAMRTLGLDPVEVLVLPRVLALVLMLPILGVIANICALVGGALMSWIELGVSPGMFMTRLGENTSVWHLAIGIIKAPFFAFTIGIIACWQAFQVKGSADSVGQRTTTSVVQSIFLVIVADAIFSVFFPELGI